MADTPTVIILADAATPDGTEHIEISQSGTLRRTTLAALRTCIAAQFILPTSDPHVSGALWNSSGTITISAG